MMNFPPDPQPRELFIWRVSILLAALAVLAVLALIIYMGGVA